MKKKAASKALSQQERKRKLFFETLTSKPFLQERRIDRRRLFGATLGVALAAGIVPGALAVVGPGANVFGPVKSKRTGSCPVGVSFRFGGLYLEVLKAHLINGEKCNCAEFIPYNARSFALMLPSKWNPASSKGAYPGIVLK